MGIGDFISGLFGSKNEEKAQGYEVDNNAYEYGGGPGGAEAMAGRAKQGQRDWQNQANQYGAQSSSLYGQGQSSMWQQQDARAQQQDAAAMARARATGQTPSIAQMQGDRAMQQAAAAQASQASSARGPAALALAQQTAAGNTAAAQSQIAGQTQIAAAQERLAAEQAYAQQAGAIRGGDQNAAQTSYGAAAQAGQLGLGAGQLGLGYSNLEKGIRDSQMTGTMNREAQKSSNALGAQGINAGVGGQNAATNQQNALGAVGLGASTATDIFTKSDERVKMPASLFVPRGLPGRANGGPVAAGQPYVVGERGPEIVVPGQDGTVIPNHAVRTWAADAAKADVDQAQAAYNARDTAASMPTIHLRPETADARMDRENNAGGGYMLGQQIATALYGGRAQGSLPASVAAGMKTAGVSEARESKKDREGADATKDATKGDKKPDAKPESKLGAIVGKLGTGLQKMADGVDTAYHGPSGGYVPPHLLTVSDESAKAPVDLSSTTGAAFAANPTAYAVKGGGMDIMGTFKAQNAALMDVAKHQGRSAGAAGPSMMSDERAKSSFGEKLAGPKNARGEYTGTADGSINATMPTLGNYADYGVSPRVTPEGRGVLVQDQEPTKVQSTKDGGEGASGQEARAASKPKAKSGGGSKASGEDLDAYVRQLQALSKTGPSVDAVSSRWGGEEAARSREAAGDIERGKAPADPMADAARSMQASTYAYKPGQTPPEQAPGEPNVGPMAQTMASNPITATAIKQDPRTGMLMIDQSKMLKVLGGVAAHQQNQIDALAARSRRKG